MVILGSIVFMVNLSKASNASVSISTLIKFLKTGLKFIVELFVFISSIAFIISFSSKLNRSIRILSRFSDPSKNFNIITIIAIIRNGFFIINTSVLGCRARQPFLYVENPQLDWGFSKAFSFESLTKKLLLIRYNCGPPTAKNYQKEVVK